MNSVTLAVEALVTAPAAPDFGASPVLQNYAGLIGFFVFVFGALFWLWGQRLGRAAAPPEVVEPRKVEVLPRLIEEHYLDGRLNAIFQSIAQVLADLDALVTLHHATREGVAEAQRLTRHDVKGAIHEGGLETEAELKAIQAQLHDLQQRIALLDQFIRIKLK